ncbi:MAG: hypothetical protein EA385_15210 [Salinarimonadaceae bacterium]|nr:MAG: hypothetical protein EA385_15210 [Salinarimonadaceae bacterium]
MARGRPRKTEGQKQASAEAKAQDIAADALLKFPADQEVRKEQFENLRRLKSDAQAAAGEISGAKKKMQDVYGIDSATIKIVEQLKALKDGRRECVIRQVQFFIKDFGLDSQLSLFDDGAVGNVEPDTGSVFDKTQSGKSQKAERGDDPGRARKSTAEAAPPPAPSGAIPLDEARKKFEEAKKIDEAKKGTARASAKAAADAGEKHIRDAAKAKAGKYAADQEKRLGPPAAPASALDEDDDLPPRSPAADADGRYSIVS